MNLTGLMRNFTIRVRMWGAIGVVAMAVVGIGGVGIAAQLYASSVTKSFLAVEFASTMELQKMRTAMDAMRRQEKDMIIQYENNNTAEQSLKDWAASFAEAQRAGKALAELLPEEASRAQAKEAMAQLEQFRTAYQPWSSQMLRLMFPSTMVAQAMLDKFMPHYDNAQAALSKIEVALLAATHAGSDRVESTSNMVVLLIAGSAGLTLFFIVPLTLLNMRSICKPIVQAEQLANQIAQGDLTISEVDLAGKDETARLMRSLADMRGSLRRTVGEVRSSTDSIRVASSEIATGNQDLSSRTEQTASNLQQAASSMDLLTGTVRQSADSARQANQLASSAAEVAARGGHVVSQVVTTMNEINASSKKISDIIGVIDGIAFQTNILALNAAVEAARAGEQGRGFAVVASEVRSLAGRSADAAKEIKGLIGASVDKVETGSRLVADAGQTMQEIVGSVQRVSDIIGEITAASAEQSDGISQVNTSVVQLDQMTQQNATLVEEGAAAAASLRDQAGRLAQVVSKFRLDDGVPTPAAQGSAPAASGQAKPRPSKSPATSSLRPASPPSAAKPAAPSSSSPSTPSPAAPAKAAVTADEWESF